MRGAGQRGRGPGRPGLRGQWEGGQGRAKASGADRGRGGRSGGGGRLAEGGERLRSGCGGPARERGGPAAARRGVDLGRVERTLSGAARDGQCLDPGSCPPGSPFVFSEFGTFSVSLVKQSYSLPILS